MGFAKSSWLLPLIAIAMTSCLTQAEVQFEEDCPDPDDCGPGYHLAAGAISDEAVAFNVVMTDADVTRKRLMQIGAEYAERHQDERVVIAFFAEAAGQERNAIEPAMFPGDSAAQPLPPSVAEHWLATLGFGAGAGAPSSIQWSGAVSP